MKIIDVGFPHTNLIVDSVSIENIDDLKFSHSVNHLNDNFVNYKHDYSKRYSIFEDIREVEFLEGYDASKYGTHVSHTSDNIILVMDNTVLKILMIKRGGYPFKNYWANPGGFVDSYLSDNGERVWEHPDNTASRELKEETGITIHPDNMFFVKNYDTKNRDPRTDVITHAYVTLLPGLVEYQPADDASDANFINVQDIFNNDYEIAFDHKQIIKDAIISLQEYLNKNRS